MNLKKIGILMLTLAMFLGTTAYASAEYEKQNSTYNGHTITSILNCDFSLFGNDRGTATTSWNGMKGYNVSVILFSQANIASKYKALSSTKGHEKAVATGSKAGVWQFKSQHYVWDKNGEKHNVCVMTDW